MDESFKKVVKQLYLITNEVSEADPDNVYKELYELSLKYAQLDEKREERIERLKLEREIAEKKLEMEDRHWQAEQDQRERWHIKEHEKWLAEQKQKYETWEAEHKQKYDIWEAEHKQKQEHWEAEQKAAGEWKDKEYEQWLMEHRQRVAIAEKDFELRTYELAEKKKSNRNGLFATIGSILVGAGSIGAGYYLGKKGLETDITSYNQSPGTLRQAESITANSTKYLN